MLTSKLFAALLTVLLSLGAVAPALSPQTETAAPEVPVVLATEPAKQTITAQQAQEIALATVEISDENVLFSPAELDREKGKLHWDIEFCSGDWEYDFEIDATTGEILHWEKEYDPEKPKAEPPVTQPEVPEVTPPPVTEPEITPPPVTEPEKTEFTAEDAKAVALAHAGLTAEEVTRMKVEKDKDDGIWVYEVEFRQGKVEFEYEIHAETGVILDWEKDHD